MTFTFYPSRFSYRFNQNILSSGLRRVWKITQTSGTYLEFLLERVNYTKGKKKILFGIRESVEERKKESVVSNLTTETLEKYIYPVDIQEESCILFFFWVFWVFFCLSWN